MHHFPPRLAVAVVAVAAACGDGGSTRPPAAPRDTVVAAGVQAPARAYVGDSLALSPAIIVTDGDGNAIADVPVTYVVTAGGGRLEVADARTSFNGRARVGRWVLGDVPGANALKVVAAGREITFATTTVERPPVAWRWSFVGTPLGDARIEGLHFDPQDDRRWYVTTIERGLYTSVDAGATWRLALTGVGLNKHGLALHPRDPNVVYAAVGPAIWASTDRGVTWERRATLAQWVRSLTIGTDGVLFVAPQWRAGEVPGVYVSDDGGRTFVHHPYGVATGTQILTWQLFEHPATGALYAANEIADHPSPYHPPLLRSRDRGVTWEDVTGALPWHVTEMTYDATGGRLYALTEGAGLWVSTDDAASWTRVAPGFGSTVFLDPRHAGWVYLGQIFYASYPGGAYLQTPPGAPPTRLGLPGLHIASFATDRAGTMLYAAAFDSGIWRAWIGDAPPGGTR